MLSKKQIDDAVTSGVITAAQAAELLRQGVGGSSTPGTAADNETETPRITRGFNDVLLALGTGLIAVAIMSQWPGWNSDLSPAVYATIPVLWLISEILNVRRRAVLPGIVAVIGMTLTACYIGSHWAFNNVPLADAQGTGTFYALGRYPAQVLLASSVAAAAVTAAYYIRFRLPFALLPLALAAGIGAVQALILTFGWQQTAAVPNIIGLVFGFALFALAMAYDTSDPLRRTRRADCGFWLHLAAAPLVVHSLLSIFGGKGFSGSSGGSAFTIGLIVLFTVVALIIDRRALIVSSLSYLLAAVGYIVSTASAVLGGSVFASLLVIGLIVIMVGMGWQFARRLLLAPFRGQPWLDKLPPVAA